MSEEGAAHESSERWLISYADFITLMFALFVVLYSVSMKDAASKNKAYNSIDKNIAGKKSDEKSAAKAIAAAEKAAKEAAKDSPQAREMAQLKQQIQAHLQKFNNPGIGVTIDSRGLVVSLSAVTFFASGDATIDQNKLPELDTVIQLLNPLHNQIRIEGFTDSNPISNQRFADNWDLSAARAGSVLRYVIEHSSIPPANFSIAGYGPYRPVASNSTEAGRSLNRHVDIVVPPTLTSDPKQILPEVAHDH
jgi:chemotaxis protein MotB